MLQGTIHTTRVKSMPIRGYSSVSVLRSKDRLNLN